MNTLSLLTDEEKLLNFKSQALSRAHDFDLEKILPLYEALYTALVPAV